MADENARRRVVITGLGMVTSIGNDVESTWRALLAGESGVAEITQFDHSDPGYSVHIACELKDFDPTIWVDRKATRRMDRFSQMIIAAARMAEQDSGIDMASENAELIGSSIATGAVLRELGPGFVSGHLKPFSIVPAAIYPLEDAKRAFVAVAGSSRDRVILRP